MMSAKEHDHLSEEFENLLHYHRESQNHINLMANRESMLIDDLETSRTAIQNVLYYIPYNVEEDATLFQSSPACSGFLVVTPVGNNDSDPQHCYCELFGHKLALKRDPNGRVRQTIPISYVQSEFAEEKEDNDLFLAHLESQEAMNSFKIFSPDGTYVLSGSADIKKAFVDTIVEELRQILDDDLWESKKQAARRLLPLEREQFQLQMDRHQQIMNSLTLTGLAHNVGLLGSENKDKAGVMRILRGREADRDKWEDFFFVLAQSTLYYFDHDPDSVTGESSLPKGFIPLKYATISLDERRIKSDRFVFQIQTPLRTVFLRARHPVALAEWVSALSQVMANCQTVHDPPQTSEQILERVQSIRSRVSSVESLLKEKKGVKAFLAFLEEDSRLVHCWIAILHYRKTLRRAKRRDPNLDQDGDDEIPSYVQESREIYTNYISRDAEETVWTSPLLRDASAGLLDGLEIRLDSADENLFGDIQNALFTVLEDQFEAFKHTEQFSQLRVRLDAKDKYFPPPLNRDIPPFQENSVLWLVVINPDLSQREIKLSKKRTLATIGRDCANTIVLDDAHVSRSHARIMYDDESAHFMDLGSHHGSYLNGERVLQEQLQEGDRLKIGGCDVIVELREHATFFQNITSRLPFARQKTTPAMY